MSKKLKELKSKLLNEAQAGWSKLDMYKRVCGSEFSYYDGYIDCGIEKENHIAKLETENAKLKERCNILDKGCETCTKFDEVRLVKAKKIIKSLLLLWEDVMTEDTVKSMINEAEQFLKEIE